MSESSKATPGWFVDAMYTLPDPLEEELEREQKDDNDKFYGGPDTVGEDRTKKFLKEGIWENYQDDKQIVDLVRSMRPGDRIAIKSSHTSKSDLPFDNRGESVSVMVIKAIGTISQNADDGKRVQVEWMPVSSVREWYFHTNPATVWRVEPNLWIDEELLAFAFHGQSQDIDRFRNGDLWREQFGDATEDQRFFWTTFYSIAAAKLLDYQSDRRRLIEGIHEMGAQYLANFQYLRDRFPEGGTGPLRDICPFTVMGTFNRSMKADNRHHVARGIADLIGVGHDAPHSFEGIPVLNNMNSWFFGYGIDRAVDDIDKLWSLFIASAALVKDNQSGQREGFISAYDAAVEVKGASWNLSMGLFWSHPWEFPTLDAKSRIFLEDSLQVPIPTIGPNRPCDGTTYLKLVDDLKAQFGSDSCPVHSFPELSLAAQEYKVHAEPHDVLAASIEHQVEPITANPGQVPSSTQRYNVNDIMSEGCFLNREEIERILERLYTRKNLILQGPPGTGKTWIAKRLAYALMGERDGSRVRAVQFHPNLSYEDFVRGWRPSGDGKLVLADGVFMDAIRAARNSPTACFIVIIEEINRGNPAQIFGELLTLLEADKREPREALELCYPDADGKRRPVYVPKNLFVIGTMNVADRSLALVDLAFRRRFAFVRLEPKLGSEWLKWVTELGVDPALVEDIKQRIEALNEQIAEAFGHQFKIGHSYVTPTAKLEPGTTREWFQQIAETEIGPQLDEYWFDAPKSAREALEKLLEGW